MEDDARHMPPPPDPIATVNPADQEAAKHMISHSRREQELMAKADKKKKVTAHKGRKQTSSTNRQWRIQDFPIGGAPTHWGGHQPLTHTLFGENVCENERN